ncbi:MAG: hypothetical protein H8E73_02125 [Planctomycetes bacterium]|nr:hypothetical protein [Planctomycetota bacterium]
MSRLIDIYDINEFSRTSTIPDAAITDTILSNVAELHEINELETAIRQIIYDPTETPHGPTEIADILTSHVHVRGTKQLAGFVLKGKSFRNVRSRDVTHQFAKLRTVPNLGLMVFAAVGHIQDDAQRDFVQTALDANCDYLIMNAHQCARLLIAYEKICPQDGTPFDDKGVCRNEHRLDDGIALDMTVREKARYTIARQEDVSHVGAKRYSANVILDRHYPRDIVREIVRDATEQMKNSRYYRNELTRARWGATLAHVVWLFVGHDLDDITNTNWVCKSCWIDPRLPKAMQPIGLTGNDCIGDIQIDWNEDYEGMKDFVDDHRRDKGGFLEELEPIKKGMIALGNKAAQLFSQYQQAQVSEDKLISAMQSMAAEADRLYDLASNLSFPPPECKEYDQACQNLFVAVHNMFLFYSDRGLETWQKSNREWLMQDTIKRYHDDIQKMEFEERKIH